MESTGLWRVVGGRARIDFSVSPKELSDNVSPSGWSESNDDIASDTRIFSPGASGNRISCSECGFESTQLDQAKFCPGCGTQLSD